MNLPKFPHSAMFVGVTACGKTEFLIQLLETIYKNHFEFIIIGGLRATAGHRKYSGILEKFYQWPLFYSQHSRSAFLVSIRVSICYVIKQTSRRIQWQDQFVCLSALVLERSVKGTW